MTDTAKILSPSELPPAMVASFEKIYSLKREIEALKAEHITPLGEEITALWRDLKAGSNMTRKDLELVFKIVERWWQAEEMEDAAEGKRIQSNIKRAFTAARRGEMVNFLDVLEDAGVETTAERDEDNDFEEDVTFAEEQFGADEDEPAGGPAEVNFSEAAPRQREDTVDGPEADWGEEDQVAVPPEQDSGDDAGRAYNLGEQAGLEGKTDVKALIKQQGWHAKSVMAKSFAAGHAKGFKAHQAEQERMEAESIVADEGGADEGGIFDEGAGSNVVGFNRPPASTTDVMQTAGDVA